MLYIPNYQTVVFSAVQRLKKTKKKHIKLDLVDKYVTLTMPFEIELNTQYRDTLQPKKLLKEIDMLQGDPFKMQPWRINYFL